MQGAKGTSSWLFLVAAGVAAIAIFLFYHSRGPSLPLDVTVPAQLTPGALEGKSIFDANCMKCHGVNAAGSDRGPPLVHEIYVPSHHSDLSFQRAAASGVKSHHWPFGDMPPVAGVTKDQVTLVIQYVRELQRANGIQ